MRGGCAVVAEVEDRGDQGRAGVVHPDLVDRDAGGQGVVAIGDPARQREPPAGARRCIDRRERV